ncbi:MAG TPA: oligosaccharide flippase family protein [Dehalococcoidia bacterium]|nr:oligosaccharide flippase family protein [Dehalococcoidia bacterium]
MARRVGSGLIWGQIGRLADLALGLALSLLIVRLLGPERYAAYAVVLSVVGFAGLIGSLGYGEALARYLPELAASDAGGVTGLLRRLTGERLVVTLIAGILVWLAAPVIAGWARTPDVARYAGLIAALIVAQGLWELLQNYFTAALRLRAFALIRMAGQIAGIGIALTLFAVAGIEVWVPLVALIANYVLTGGLFLGGVVPALRGPARRADLAAARRFGRYVWLTNLATLGLAGQVDVLLIAALLPDPAQAGFYNAAVLLLGRLYSVLTGWTAVLVPAAAAARARQGVSGLARSYALYLKLSLLTLVPPLIFTGVWAEAIALTLFGGEYAAVAPLIVLYAAFNLASALAGAIISQPLLQVAERQRTLLWLRVGAGGLNVLLDILLIPRLGAAGAVVATGAANLTVHLIEWVLLQRLTGAGYPAAVALKLTGASLVAALPALGLPRDGWPGLIAGGAAFVLLLAAALWWLRLLSAEDRSVIETALPRLAPIVRRLART